MLFLALSFAMSGAAFAEGEGGEEGFLAEDRAETLFSGEIESGVYGGPHVKMTLLNGEVGVLMGGRGGWVINHAFVIGGLGYSVVSDPELSVDQGAGSFYMRYGGLFLEGIFLNKKVAHFTVEGFGGSGTVGFDAGGTGQNEDNIFVVEGTVRLEMNMTDWFRLAVGPGYRLVTGIDAANLDTLDLSGPAVELIAKFGYF